MSSDVLSGRDGAYFWRCELEKHAFFEDFKGAYGEDEFRRLSKDEIYFWTSFYYNCGSGCGKGQLTGEMYKDGRGNVVKGKGRENLYKPLEHEETGIRDPRTNALIRSVTRKWIDSTGVFEYPSI